MPDGPYVCKYCLKAQTHGLFAICTLVRHLLACASMDCEIVGEITSLETIASGSGVRERARLRRQYGQGRWRKRKGVARVRLVDSPLRLAEIHCTKPMA